MTTAFPHGLELILTSRCDLACTYCYEAGRDSREDLSWEAAKRAIDFVLTRRPPTASISFGGGEPLLAEDLLRRCVAYANETKDRGTSLEFATSTNGTLGDVSLARFLAENDFELQVSWDGAAQERRAPGTGARVRRFVRRTAAADPGWFRRRVRVAFTVTPANLSLLADSIEDFLAAGVRNVVVAPAGNLSWPSPETIEESFDRAFEGVVRAVAPLARSGNEIPVWFLRPPTTFAPAVEGRCPCVAASPDSFAVAPDGVAWACSYFAASMQRLTPAGREVAGAFHLGDVRDPAFPARLAALPDSCAAVPALARRSPRRSPLGECASCELRSACTPCPAAGTRLPGNDDPLLVPAAECAFTRAAARARSLLPRSLPLLVRDLAALAARIGAASAGLPAPADGSPETGHGLSSKGRGAPTDDTRRRNTGPDHREP